MCKNDLLHGKGKMINKNDGSVYDGEWFDDKREGYGIFTISTHDTSSTTIDEITYTTGAYMYQGYYRNNKKDGDGIENDIAGNKITGTWKDGELIKGKCEYAQDAGKFFL